MTNKETTNDWKNNLPKIVGTAFAFVSLIIASVAAYHNTTEHIQENLKRHFMYHIQTIKKNQQHTNQELETIKKEVRQLRNSLLNKN